MSTLAIGLLALAVAVAMEGYSAWIHHRLWHRSLWPAHRSHHRGPRDIAYTGKKAGKLEFNDLFGLCHAAVAAPLMYWSLHAPHAWVHSLGLGLSCGMSAFGAAYFLVHDGLVHGRLPVGFLRRWRYLRRVEAAHRVHHQSGEVPYGLFFGPWALRAAVRRRRRAAACQGSLRRVGLAKRLLKPARS